MNYLSDTLFETQEQVFHNGYNNMRAEQLQEQLANLNEWKMKAKVQLEYFRSACTLYNLCDIHDVNELLKD